VAEPTGPGEQPEPVPEDVYGSWSPSPAPDGDRVAFVSDRSGAPRVWIRGPASAGPAPVPAVLDRVSTVSWSPDGQWLACVAAAAGASRTQVWALRPAGRRTAV
jgi:Tol biopolymer transport system component